MTYENKISLQIENTVFEITVEQPRYIPSIEALRLSPPARFPIASACPTLVDAQLDTSFPEKAASRLMASSRRLRDIATIDGADNTPFDAPAS